MIQLFQSAVRPLADAEGVFKGWRLAAAIWVAGAVFCGISVASIGWEDGVEVGIMVVGGMFFATGALLGCEDAWRRRRDARLSEALGREVRTPAVSRGMQRVLAGLALPAIVLVMGFGAWALVQLWAPVTWPSAPGTVVSVHSKGGRDHSELMGPTRYRVTAAVVYRVAGQEYRRALQPRGMDKIESEWEAGRIKAEFAAGTVHPVYYKPSDPQRASLRRWPGIGVAIGTVAGPAIGVGVLVMCGCTAFGRPVGVGGDQGSRPTSRPQRLHVLR